eukprot:3786217-Heterocapsa_arctica.AAC.1
MLQHDVQSHCLLQIRHVLHQHRFETIMSSYSYHAGHETHFHFESAISAGEHCFLLQQHSLG